MRRPQLLTRLSYTPQRIKDAYTSASLYVRGDNHTRQRFYSELQHILGPYFELYTIMKTALFL